MPRAHRKTGEMVAKPGRILTRSRCDKPGCLRWRSRLKRAAATVAGTATSQAGEAPRTLSQIDGAQQPSLLSLPYEVHIKIFGYLDASSISQVRHVCQRLRDILHDWKEYQICDDNQSTSDIIKELKCMRYLKKVDIRDRSDCDTILHQISISNTGVEEISIKDCRGSTFGVYLRAVDVTRLVQRCKRLHTFQLHGTRVHGCKLFRTVAEVEPPLRLFQATTTRQQFREFVRYAAFLPLEHRRLILIKYTSPVFNMTYCFVAKTAEKPAKTYLTFDTYFGMCLPASDEAASTTE